MMRTRVLSVVALGLLVVAGGGSPAAGASRARVSARLTRTSFTASQAGSVKLTYRFSKASRRFSYVLTFQKGSRWQTVKSVKKTGHFRGSRTVTVRSLFAGKSVHTGSYRLRLAADGPSTLLRFKVAVRPRAGTWATTSLSGPVSGGGGVASVTITSMSFTVRPGQASVGTFGFGYQWYGTPGPPTYHCSGSGASSMTSGNSSPITNARFSSPNPTGAWDGAMSGLADGTFDTATTAHGTAKASGFVGGGSGCWSITGQSVETGTFSWTATWSSAG